MEMGVESHNTRFDNHIIESTSKWVAKITKKYFEYY